MQEKAMIDGIADTTKKMMERLTVNEQVRVAFVPIIISQLAWLQAEKAMDLSARYRVDLLKKINRRLRETKQQYDMELRGQLDFAHQCNVKGQMDMLLEEISGNLTIMYFSVNQEFKRVVPDYPYDDLRTYAIMSLLFVDMLRKHNLEMDKILAEKVDRNIPPSVLPPDMQTLKFGMEAFAGVDGKFNYDDINVRNSAKIIKNKIDTIEFEVV